MRIPASTARGTWLTKGAAKSRMQRRVRAWIMPAMGD
jgi:hypothetical protein